MKILHMNVYMLLLFFNNWSQPMKKSTKRKYPLTRGEWASQTQVIKDKAISALNTFDKTLFINKEGEQEGRKGDLNSRREKICSRN